MSQDPKAPINWHFLPWEFEVRTDAGVQQGTRDVQHEPELPAGTHVAVRGVVHTYVYVIHISADKKVTQLYPAPTDGPAELESLIEHRMPAEPQSFLTLPSAGVIRVVVSQQEIQPDDWARIGVLEGREPPPKGVRAY